MGVMRRFGDFWLVGPTDDSGLTTEPFRKWGRLRWPFNGLMLLGLAAFIFKAGGEFMSFLRPWQVGLILLAANLIFTICPVLEGMFASEGQRSRGFSAAVTLILFPTISAAGLVVGYLVLLAFAIQYHG